MLIVQIMKTIMLWSMLGACHWARLAASWEFWQAQRHLTRHNCHHCSFCCRLMYGSCRFPWNPNDWFLIGRDHVVWCMPHCNHMPYVYFSCVVDFALGVLTWAMSHIYNQGALNPFSDLCVQACLSHRLNSRELGDQEVHFVTCIWMEHHHVWQALKQMFGDLTCLCGALCKWHWCFWIVLQHAFNHP
jgi:hypothetical protein